LAAGAARPSRASRAPSFTPLAARTARLSFKTRDGWEDCFISYNDIYDCQTALFDHQSGNLTKTLDAMKAALILYRYYTINGRVWYKATEVEEFLKKKGKL
jgi:hypothetical protein